MTMISKIAVIAFALTGIALTSGCMSDRDGRYGRDRGAMSFDFGDVAVGYRDGYWDNRHNWHQWGDDGHRQSYRSHQGNHYNDWNHDRDGDDGSRRNNSR